MTPIETVQALVDALDFRAPIPGSRGDKALLAGRALLAQMQAGNGLAETERSDEKDSAPVVQVVEPRPTGKPYIDSLIDRLVMPPPSMTERDLRKLHIEAAEMLRMLATVPQEPRDA